jgi:hypothetical protein
MESAKTGHYVPGIPTADGVDRAIGVGVIYIRAQNHGWLPGVTVDRRPMGPDQRAFAGFYRRNMLGIFVNHRGHLRVIGLQENRRVITRV